MAQEQNAPTEETKPLPNLSGEPEYQEEEVEIPLEEGETPPAPEAVAEEETPKPKTRRGPKRYAALTHERDEARSYAAQLEAELQRARAQAAEFENKANEASKVAMQTFASKAETDLREARAYHAAAIDSGDSARMTEAAERLASAKATMDDIEAWKKSEANKPATPQPQAQPQAQVQAPIEDLPPGIKEWAVENRYWDQVARDESGNILLDRTGRPLKNPDFDEEMHIEATMYATKLERQIAAGKLPYKVASPEYLKAVDEHMRKEFPDHFGGEEEAEEAPAPQRRASPVAAPSRSVPQSSSNAPSQRVKLTAEQVRFVEKQVSNNGGPKYPKGHPKQFTPMSLDDAKVSFARRLQSLKNQ